MNKKKYIFIACLLIGGLSIGLWGSLYIHKLIYSNNITSDSPTYIYISTGSKYQDVYQYLSDSVLIDSGTFDRVAKKKKYDQKIKPGRYKIEPSMSNNELVNMLRGGRQSPVRVTFNNLRTKEQLSEIIAQQLELSSNELLTLLNDESFLANYHLDNETAVCLFIPNTYEFWWNTSAKQFVERMSKEYHKFWNENRQSRANAIGLTAIEVSILASIVEEENHLTEEQPTIAGLYINRLKRGWNLESDPTVRYALGNFNIRRVLKKDLEVDSPYNTYRYAGLPPGPIRIPSPISIDAVLNYQHHNYMFMCAKDDLSGLHHFSVSAAEHEKYARKYRQALNNRNIKR